MGKNKGIGCFIYPNIVLAVVLTFCEKIPQFLRPKDLHLRGLHSVVN